jgi:hypothetical protein
VGYIQSAPKVFVEANPAWQKSKPISLSSKPEFPVVQVRIVARAYAQIPVVIWLELKRLGR